MGISLRTITNESESVRDDATEKNVPYPAVSARELITPQYQVGVDSSKKDWFNWVGQHDDTGRRREYRPTNRKQLIAAVVKKAHSRGKVRAVGSGHSHSNAPEPPDHYIELNPGAPGNPQRDGLNEPLNHHGWLKSDQELRTVKNANDINGPFDREHLVRLESGMLLHRLIRHVLRDETAHNHGYALKNMGSFDGQTIAGAVNTSTHGTGIGLSSIADSVWSVEIATVPESTSGDPIVRMFRIEPTNGITDRAAFEQATATHEMELIQDDEVFRSVVVGYGCMGVVYAYTLQVVDNYWLKETTRLVNWSQLKTEMGSSKKSVREFLKKNDTRHCQILVNTAAWQVPKNKIKTHSGHGEGVHEGWRDPLCLVKRHSPTSIQSVPTIWTERWPPERRTKPFRQTGKSLFSLHPLKPNNGKAKNLHKFFFHPEYNKQPFVKGRDETVWYVALRRPRDRGDQNASEYRHPEHPQPATPTTEIGVPFHHVTEAVDVYGEVVRGIKQGDQIPDSREKNAEGRPVFFTSPMGIRFTDESEHYLSPEYDRKTAMVELPLPIGVIGETIGGGPNVPELTFDEMRRWVVEPALTKAEQRIRRKLNAKGIPTRPHMGKHNTVDGQWLDDEYDHFDATGTSNDIGWYQAYQRFNAFGTFDNEFTAEKVQPYSPRFASEDHEG